MPFLTWLAVLPALAAPDAPFTRAGETPSARRYAKVAGDGPVWAAYRNAKGSFEAWVFRDGTVEHYVRWDGRRPAEARRFGPTGLPFTSTRYQDGAPAEVVVHGVADVPVAVGDWQAHDAGVLTVRAPAPPVASDGVYVWQWPDATVTVRSLEGFVDVWSDTFRDGLFDTCGCTPLDRAAAWLDGRPAARYLVRIPDAGRVVLGEVWAVPQPRATVLLAYTGVSTDPDAADDPAASLAKGRAFVSLAAWEGR